MNVVARWHGWIHQLQEFNSNNAGRLALIETDDSETSSPRAGSYHFLREIVYDACDNQIEIVLGELSSTDVCVTHTIRDPQEIALQSDRDGRDASLWVGRQGGQTLLRLY